MPQILLLLTLVLTVVLVVHRSRAGRDRSELSSRIRERGGVVARLTRMQRGSPFTDIGRGWWAWRVEWNDQAGLHTSWALTTKHGLKEWRD